MTLSALIGLLAPAEVVNGQLRPEVQAWVGSLDRSTGDGVFPCTSDDEGLVRTPGSVAIACGLSGLVTGSGGTVFDAGNFSGSASVTAVYGEAIARAHMSGDFPATSYAQVSTSGFFYQYLTLTNPNIARVDVQGTVFGNTHVGGGLRAFSVGGITMYSLNARGFDTESFGHAFGYAMVGSPAIFTLSFLLSNAPATFQNRYAIYNLAQADVMSYFATTPVSGEITAETRMIGSTVRVFDAAGSEIQGGYTLTEAMPPTSTVPEPATLTLLGTGLAGILAAKRRRNKRSAA